jgi:O-antigen/teichoic acid export membrane protein
MFEKLKRLKNDKSFIKYFHNTSWLLSDKIVRMAVGLFVGVWVARYLGPEQLGILSYALAIISFVGVFSYLGLSGILVHEIVDKPGEHDEILGTVFLMKVIGSIVAYIIIVIISFLTTDVGSTKFWILIIVGLSLFFRPIEVLSLFNESKVMAKYSTKASLYAFTIITLLKVILILSSTSLLFFGLVSPLQALISSSFLLFFFFKQGYSVKKWTINLDRAKELLGKSWKLIFSSVLAIIYLKIDLIMLSSMIDDHAVGIYSVAATLSEAWYFIPGAIVSSLFPALIKKKKENYIEYEKKLQQLYDFLFLIAFSLAIIISFFSEQIIFLLYGEAYNESVMVLVVHIWAGIFIFMRTLFSKWIIMENLLILSLYSHVFGALLNVVLNFVFIPEYGAVGAAITTLISYMGAAYLGLFIHHSSRGQAKMMTLSLLLPFRILIYRGQLWRQ